jgi:hypothetical protein
MSENTLMDENFPTHLRVVLPSDAAAEAVSSFVKNETGLEPGQLRVATPREDPDRGTTGGVTELQPRPLHLRRLQSAIAGLIAGAMIFLVLWSAGIHSIEAHWPLAAGALGLIGLLSGIWLAGLASWRPGRPSPLTQPSKAAEGEDDAVTLEIEVHDLSQHYAVRRALDKARSQAAATLQTYDRGSRAD